MTLRVFTGWDEREKPGWHACIDSLVSTSTNWVLMPPLSGRQGDGTNAFNTARFMVPELCNWAGPALFLDAVDMLLLDDLSKVLEHYDPSKAVQVVKHAYKTKHPRKYVGTEMESENVDYERKNWSSFILWNCGHMVHFQQRAKIRRAIERGEGSYLHRFGWIPDKDIGALPAVYNWLPQEFGDNPEAKVIHYTAGAPFMAHYRDTPMSNHWHETVRTYYSER